MDLARARPQGGGAGPGQAPAARDPGPKGRGETSVSAVGRRLWLRGLLVGSLVLAGSIGIRGQALEPVDFERWYAFEDATGLAREHGRAVMAYFWSATCPYCWQMDTFVLPDPAVSDYLRDHYVVALVNMDEPEGQSLARRFRVVGTPTFVFLALQASGWEEVGRLVGARTARQFGQELRDMCARALGGERCA